MSIAGTPPLLWEPGTLSQNKGLLLSWTQLFEGQEEAFLHHAKFEASWARSHFPPITNTHSTLCSATTGTSSATASFNAIALFGLSYHSLTPLPYNSRRALLSGESSTSRVMKILLTGSLMLSLAFGKYPDTHKYTHKQTNPEPKARGRNCSFPDHHQSGTKSKKL